MIDVIRAEPDNGGGDGNIVLIPVAMITAVLISTDGPDDILTVWLLGSADPWSFSGDNAKSFLAAYAKFSRVVNPTETATPA